MSASNVDFRDRVLSQSWRVRGVLPSRTWGPREMFSWGARTAAFLGAILSVFAGVVVVEIAGVVRPRKEEVGCQTLRRAGGGPRQNWKVRSGAESSPRPVLAFLALSSSALRRGDLLVASEHCRFFPSAHHSKARRLLFFPICFSHTHHHTAFRSRTPQRPQAFSCARRVC